MQLHLGLALFWANSTAPPRPRGARPRTSSPTRRTPSSPRICSTLGSRPGCRSSCRRCPSRPRSSASRPGEQLRLLRRGRRRGPAWRLYYGVALQRAGRRVSARRAFDAAAARSPAPSSPSSPRPSPGFDKDRPEEAFSRLGPLTRRFPHSASVRFHLGLLLLWTGQAEEARRQLRLAQRAETDSPLAREAGRWLERLPSRSIAGGPERTPQGFEDARGSARRKRPVAGASTRQIETKQRFPTF